ncbi:hypothetical protein SEMRO_1085_G239530.1 [Seminavis robusta]|uniref:Uncharacterized protein n=1 Tax=Seminavis robusta TaxID=568900 RepID=A0A9N8EFN0_9STRA|nr:hypothetical protein SEMRO_1085_G239530.1 [Seminavis robusta]|eukprot:Sro1085_g239530.1 n/a (182) ;mRNA; r:2617-3162
MCKSLEDNHDGLVPWDAASLMELAKPEISVSVANTVIQDVFGIYAGPVVDYYYGTRMAVALDLIDVAEHHYNKRKIDARLVSPVYVRESIMSWLPQEDWKDFHTVLVSAAQILVEPPNDNQVDKVKKLVRKKFGTADKVLVLGMIESIIEYFGISNGEINVDTLEAHETAAAAAAAISPSG